MKHLFVPYELALKLKEKGFDEECFGNYDCWSKKEPARLMTNIYPYFLGQEYAKRFDKTCILAPLYQQVIDWFREKNIQIIELPTQNFRTIKWAVSDNGKFKGGFPLDEAIEEALKFIP